MQKLGSEARSVANVTEWAVCMPGLEASYWETVGDKTDWLKQEKTFIKLSCCKTNCSRRY